MREIEYFGLDLLYMVENGKDISGAGLDNDRRMGSRDQCRE
jgi:hypothetical protein